MGISRINNNLNAQSIRILNNLIGPQLQQNIERLASGLRINRAGDDAAGLSIFNRIQSQLRGLNEAFDAAQTGVNLINTGDQALGSITDRLQRIRELTVQAGNTGVYDRQAVQAIQSEINQNIDEISRIANTTQFGANRLFSGDFAATAGIRPGTPDRGVNVDNANLTTRENFFTITQVQEGSARIVGGDPVGDPQIVNAGIRNAQDIAVSQGAFFNSTGGTDAVAGDALTDLTFNGVALQSGGTLSFEGVLADGTTRFSGSIQIDPGSDLNDLANAMQSSISAAEQGAGVNTPGGATNVAFNEQTGRMEFRNAAQQGVSGFDIDFTVRNAGGALQNRSGATRDATLGGQIGNAVDAFTGSTFATGDLRLEVSDVVAAQQRAVETQGAFQRADGGALGAVDSLIGAVFNGATLAQGDTINLRGVNVDGSTFNSTFTISTVTAGAGDGAATTFQDLIDEMNLRDRSFAAGGVGRQSGFETATAGIGADGRIRVVDDMAGESRTSFTLTVNDNSAGGGTFGTIVDDARLVREGQAESATMRINDGPAQRVTAGQTVTLRGTPTDSSGLSAPEITFRVGDNLSVGADTIRNTQALFSGTLNSGPEVRFSAGEQDVQFVSGLSPGETLTLDFDARIDVPGIGSQGAGTVIISAVGRQANFQLGANPEQQLGVSFGNMRADMLGLGQGRSVSDINVMREGGVGEALRIIDAALSQVDATRSEMGAVSNRLESTASSLAITAENLLASSSRIADADFAREATNLTRNQLLLRANIAIQSQANNLQNILFTNLLR